MLMMPGSGWVTMVTTIFIVVTVSRLVSGQYSLQAPTSHVALSGSVQVSFTIPGSSLSYPPTVQLIDLSNKALRNSRTVPVATSGAVTFECGYFDHEGPFQFRLQSTRNTSFILTVSNVINVKWPEIEFSIPPNLMASDREFEVIAGVTTDLCLNMRNNRFVVSMLLVYHGMNLTSVAQTPIPVGDGVVADSLTVGVISPEMRVSYGCRSADRAGLYSVMIQSDFSQSTVDRSDLFEVYGNPNYDISVSAMDVLSECSGAGRNTPITAQVTQPQCANDDDTVRLLGQTESFSYTPSPAGLSHIAEQRILTMGTALQFYCSDFSDIYTGFCFRYVSVARSGAVDDQATVCIPKEYAGEPIDGGWSAWSEWGDCTASCGPGVRHRSRSCDEPSPANGGAACPGNLLMTEFCDLPPCPTDSSLLTSTTPDPNCFCGCTMTSPVGNILSNQNLCSTPTTIRWVISVPGNRFIRLEFVYFYLSIHREYLRMRDGRGGNSPLLAYHTGVALPGPVTSSGNSMYIEYRALGGADVAKLGFNALYASFVSNETPAPPLGVIDSETPPVDVGEVNNTAILIAGIVLGVLVVLFAIVFAIHARCSRDYEYKPGMPHDDTAETQLRGIGIGTPSSNSSVANPSRPWIAAPIGRSTTSQSEQSHQSTSKRGWPDGDRNQLYVVHNETPNYHYQDASPMSSSQKSTSKILPNIPSPYHEKELERWTKKHGPKTPVPFHAKDSITTVSRGSGGEHSTSKHSGRTDRNTTHLAMKSPQEFAMTGMHSSRTSMASSKRHEEHMTSHMTPQVDAVAKVENADNTSPYVNKDGQLTPLGLAVSKLNDNGMAFRIPEGAESPDHEQREHKHRTGHHRHREHSGHHNAVADVTHHSDKKRREKSATKLDEESPQIAESENNTRSHRKLPLAPKMAFYSDDEPDFRPAPSEPEDNYSKAETLPRDKSSEKTREKSRDKSREKSREKSSHSRGTNSQRGDQNHHHRHHSGALSPHRTSKEEGLESGHSSTLRSDKSASLERRKHRDKSHKPPIPPKHESRAKKHHGEKPAIPPRPDAYMNSHFADESRNTSDQGASTYSIPNDHYPPLSDYSGQMSVEPSPIRLPRPLNRKQNREQLTQVFISDESLMRPQSGAESSRSGTSHRQLPETPPYGFSPVRHPPRSASSQKVHRSDLSLSLSQEEPEFDYYIPNLPGSFFENQYPMGMMGDGPSQTIKRLNKNKPKSPSASLV